MPLIVVFVAYLVAALIGLEFAPDGGSATAIWAPAGIAVASVWLLGNRALISVAAAAFLANALHSTTPLLASAAIASGNTFAAWVAGLMLTSLAFTGLRARVVRDYGVLALTALAAALLASSLGVESLHWFADQPTEEAWHTATQICSLDLRRRLCQST